MPNFDHVPVLLDRVVDLLAAVPAGLVVDATVGGAGHAAAAPRGAPRHPAPRPRPRRRAVAVRASRLARFGDRAVVRPRALRPARESSATWDEEGVIGVLFDLGVSSPQLDQAETRASRTATTVRSTCGWTSAPPRTAADVVNGTVASELADVLRRYGDERFARRIADADRGSTARSAPPPSSPRSCATPSRRRPAASRRATPPDARSRRSASRSTRSSSAGRRARPGDRRSSARRSLRVAMSYHSGEDRIVKDRFRQAVTGGCVCPPGLPCGCGVVVPEFVVRGAEQGVAQTRSRPTRGPRASASGPSRRSTPSGGERAS